MASKKNRSRGTNQVEKVRPVDPTTIQMVEKEMFKDGVPPPKQIPRQEEKMSLFAKALPYVLFFSTMVGVPVLYVKYCWPIPETPLPSFSFSQAHPYEFKFRTLTGVDFYVDSPTFEEDFPPETYKRDEIESLVYSKYVSVLKTNCADELVRKTLGLTSETPYCVLAYQFDPNLAASLLRPRRGYN